MYPIKKNCIHSMTHLPVIITFCISFSSYIEDRLLHLKRLAAGSKEPFGLANPIGIVHGELVN
jgi:hypothetical protein